MTIKRLILIILTFFAIAKVLLSLGESFNQPQIQNRLELYQTNLVLKATEVADKDLASAREAILGNDPYLNAQKQYQEVRQEANITRSKLQGQLNASPSIAVNPSPLQITPPVQAVETSPQQQQLQAQISQASQFIEELDLKIGILQVQRGEIETALQTWQGLNPNSSPLAETLTQLWSESPRLLPNTESQIQKNLDGWFRYRALAQLYTLQQRQDALTSLQTEAQAVAEQSLLKLGVVAGIPVIFGILGVVLLVAFLIQWGLQGENAVLATNQNTGWETPWNWEIIWQVLIVGFFFISQFLLPILFGSLGLNPANLDIRAKAIYVLASYFSMAFGGLLVLFLSIRKFLPLPEGWFRINPFSNWFLWGFGGYVIAIPLVVFVSLINQQIWQGQGGSNPILFLALQAQDKVALGLFFFTASVAAPVFEEIIFRGFLLPSLTRYLPVWGAILASSLLFSVAHLSLSEMLPLTTLGIVLAVVYTRSRNLLSSILLHSLWNSGTLFSLFVLGSQ